MYVCTTNDQTAPFALRQHVPADVCLDEDVGNSDAKWTWEPKGDVKPEDFAIYASGQMFTSQRTGMNQMDHGEFQ